MYQNETNPALRRYVMTIDDATGEPLPSDFVWLGGMVKISKAGGPFVDTANLFEHVPGGADNSFSLQLELAEVNTIGTLTIQAFDAVGGELIGEWQDTVEANPVAVTPTVGTFVGSDFAALVTRADRAAQAALGGEVVTYAPQVGALAYPIGMFDEVYVLAKGDGEAGVESVGPAVFLRLEDLPVHPDDDEPTLTIRGANYRVTERRPDGIGGIVLVLRRVG